MLLPTYAVAAPLTNSLAQYFIYVYIRLLSIYYLFSYLYLIYEHYTDPTPELQVSVSPIKYKGYANIFNYLFIYLLSTSVNCFVH